MRHGIAAVLLREAINALPSFAEQTSGPRRIGVILGGFQPHDFEVEQFRQGLRDAGYTEGRDLVIDLRPTAGHYDDVPQLVRELLQHNVDVIVVDTTFATKAAKQATSTVPIIMTDIADPVGSGLVRSLAHPGANITGLTIMTDDLAGKRLQLLKEAMPSVRRVAVLWNPDAAWFQAKTIDQLKASGATLSIDVLLVGVRTVQEMNSAIGNIKRAQVQALDVIEDALFYANRAALLALASRAGLPTVHGQKVFVEAGGMMSYGPSFADLFRRAAGYVDKVLKGAQPADLPIEQPTQFELAVNLKTAKAFGISIPESILARADKVIR
jgi:putative tryptophan/tyrosine transport system substrate-binding protein